MSAAADALMGIFGFKRVEGEMSMTEVKTADLVGAALDWATFCAVFSGMQPTIRKIESVTIERQPFIKPLTFPSVVYLTYSGAYGAECSWNPSSAWEDGGPLIEKYQVMITYHNAPDRTPLATLASTHPAFECGETVLISACRAIVAAKLGDVVSVPSELLEKAE